jgi:hypothetical protein
MLDNLEQRRKIRMDRATLDTAGMSNAKKGERTLCSGRRTLAPTQE